MNMHIFIITGGAHNKNQKLLTPVMSQKIEVFKF